MREISGDVLARRVRLIRCAGHVIVATADLRSAGSSQRLQKRDAGLKFGGSKQERGKRRICGGWRRRTWYEVLRTEPPRQDPPTACDHNRSLHRYGRGGPFQAIVLLRVSAKAELGGYPRPGPNARPGPGARSCMPGLPGNPGAAHLGSLPRVRETGCHGVVIEPGRAGARRSPVGPAARERRALRHAGRRGPVL